MNEAIQLAVEQLETYGYCVLEKRMSAALAQSLAVRCLELHAAPQYQEYIHGDEHYQTLFGMPNLDDRVWDFAAHADVLAIVRHFLGDHCRAVEACSKPAWPGAPPQHLHVDSSGYFKQVPNIPWMINTIWMLTDFTIENGATGIVPMSHCSGLKTPPASIGHDSPLIKPVTGPAGSVMLWHGGAFHQARANTSAQIRVGLNIAYYPPWFNNWFEGGHQPIWPETYARMPGEIQAIWPRCQSRNRTELYER